MANTKITALGIDNMNINYINEMMRWHFSESTGSPFWLEILGRMDFDPIERIHKYEDLKLFDDISLGLSTISADQLVPRGLKHNQDFSVYESGGTTGIPKFFTVYDEWLDELLDWRVSPYLNQDQSLRGNSLSMVPSGPHMVGEINKLRAKKLGGMNFTIDIDPRWVTKMVRNKNHLAIKEYKKHIISQAKHILKNQNIKYISCTPSLLSELFSCSLCTEIINKNVRHINLGGLEINLDEIKFVKEQIAPNVEFSAVYGSTSKLGFSCSDLIKNDSKTIRYRSFFPYITYDVIDCVSGQSVDDNERGQVVVSHISKYAFFPRIIERDTAIKHANSNAFGCDLSDVENITASKQKTSQEGVY